MAEYQYPEFDKEGKIICQICGKSFSMVTPSHLQRKHNMSLEEYRNKFPDISLTSNQFNKSRKYETSDLFTPSDEPVIESEINDTEPDEDPIFEDLENQIPVNTKTKKPDKITLNRLRVLRDLQKFYKHVQQNYIIQKFAKSGKLEYEFVTDYADPLLKIIVNFPRVFWHNKDIYQDPNKNNKLMKDGWKIFEIYSPSASTKDINEAMKK